jgi:hypothetical protein
MTILDDPRYFGEIVSYVRISSTSLNLRGYLSIGSSERFWIDLSNEIGLHILDVADRYVASLKVNPQFTLGLRDLYNVTNHPVLKQYLDSAEYSNRVVDSEVSQYVPEIFAKYYPPVDVAARLLLDVVKTYEYDLNNIYDKSLLNREFKLDRYSKTKTINVDYIPILESLFNNKGNVDGIEILSRELNFPMDKLKRSYPPCGGMRLAVLLDNIDPKNKFNKHKYLSTQYHTDSYNLFLSELEDILTGKSNSNLDTVIRVYLPACATITSISNCDEYLNEKTKYDLGPGVLSYNMILGLNHIGRPVGVIDKNISDDVYVLFCVRDKSDLIIDLDSVHFNMMTTDVFSETLVVDRGKCFILSNNLILGKPCDIIPWSMTSTEIISEQLPISVPSEKWYIESETTRMFQEVLDFSLLNDDLTPLNGPSNFEFCTNTVNDNPDEDYPILNESECTVKIHDVLTRERSSFDLDVSDNTPVLDLLPYTEIFPEHLEINIGGNHRSIDKYSISLSRTPSALSRDFYLGGNRYLSSQPVPYYDVSYDPTSTILGKDKLSDSGLLSGKIKGIEYSEESIILGESLIGDNAYLSGYQ